MPAKKTSGATERDKLPVKKVSPSPKSGTRSSARIFAAAASKENIQRTEDLVEVKPKLTKAAKKPLKLAIDRNDASEVDVDVPIKPKKELQPAKPSKKPIPVSEDNNIGENQASVAESAKVIDEPMQMEKKTDTNPTQPGKNEPTDLENTTAIKPAKQKKKKTLKKLDQVSEDVNMGENKASVVDAVGKNGPKKQTTSTIKLSKKPNALSDVADVEVKENPIKDADIDIETDVDSSVTPPKGSTETIVLAIEACKSCHTFVLRANDLFKELSALLPDASKLALELTINEKAPRRGAFEISLYQKDNTGEQTEIWTGIKKGPPRKNKFPDAATIMEKILEFAKV